ncbi:MAG: hypothetical protein R8M45_06495 [Ghiorsea sp.]
MSEGSEDNQGTKDGNQGGGEDNKKLLEEIKSLRNEAAGYRVKLKESQASEGNGVDKDKYEQMVAAEQAREQESLEAKGKYEESLENSRVRSQKALDTAQNNADGWKGKFETQVVDNVIQSSVASNIVDSASPSEVALMVRGVYDFKVNDIGEVTVLTKQGDVVMDDKGSNLTVSQVSAKFLADRPFLNKANPSGSGSNSNTGGRGASNGQQNLSPIDKIAQALNA